MRLLIADDHVLFREMMAQYVGRADSDAMVELAQDLDDAVRLVGQMEVPPDLVLLDLNMPGMHGLEGFSRFRTLYPAVPVALLSGVAEPADVQAAMDMGAMGYFPKTLSGRALLKAIELVLLGEKYIPVDTRTNGLMPSYYTDSGAGKTVVALPFHTTGAAVPVAQDFGLTPRETEVLAALCLGKSNKDIARDLDLQPVTVKLHVSGVCRKLDVATRTQAVIRAFELGLVKQA